MYEKRKYGSKVRYRVTESSDNFSAKQAARLIREYGIGAQVDTWEGGYAVWADKKITSRQRDDIVKKALSKPESRPKSRPKSKKPVSLVYPVPYGENVRAPSNKFDRFFWACTMGDMRSSDGLAGDDLIEVASMFFKITKAEARKLYRTWYRKARKERDALAEYYKKYPDEAPL